MVAKRQTLGFLAANVRRLRLKHDLTQAQLAEQADISPIHVQRIERGIVDARVSTIVALADALATTPDKLLRPARAVERRVGRPKG